MFMRRGFLPCETISQRPTGAEIIEKLPENRSYSQKTL